MSIPGLRGVRLWFVATRAVRAFGKDDMFTFAAALAFHVLLALFPFLIFLIALLGSLRLPGFFTWIIDQARLLVPTQSIAPIEAIVGQIQHQAHGGLLSFSIIGALWAASAGMRATMRALNAAYHIEESRPTLRRYMLSVIYTIGLAILLILATGLMLIGPQVMTWLSSQIGWDELIILAWTWLRWPVAILLLILIVAIIYAFAPNSDLPFRLVSPGAVVAVVLWMIVSQGFSFYIANFGTYSATYGSIGAVIVLLLYLFLSAVVLLFGAEVNVVIDQQSSADQNQSPERLHEPHERAVGEPF